LFFEVLLKFFLKRKTPTEIGAFHYTLVFVISQTYSGNVAPVGCTTKSNTINSAVLVG